MTKFKTNETDKGQTDKTDKRHLRQEIYFCRKSNLKVKCYKC